MGVSERQRSGMGWAFQNGSVLEQRRRSGTGAFWNAVSVLREETAQNTRENAALAPGRAVLRQFDASEANCDV